MKDNFGEVFDSLNNTYSSMETVLGDLYNDIQNNPNNEKIELFNSIANVAKDLLTSQREFVDSYADNNMKEFCENSVASKEELIQKSIQEINGRSFK